MVAQKATTKITVVQFLCWFKTPPQKSPWSNFYGCSKNNHKNHRGPTFVSAKKATTKITLQVKSLDSVLSSIPSISHKSPLAY